jgi:hypothetical protein
MKPTRKDLIAAAADVYDCGKDRAERDLIAIDWWICQRVCVTGYVGTASQYEDRRTGDALNPWGARVGNEASLTRTGSKSAPLIPANYRRAA